MRRIFGLSIGLLLFAQAGLAREDIFCSDASGHVRMIQTKKKSEKKVKWLIDGQQVSEKNLFATLRTTEAIHIYGDKYNGLFAAPARVKIDQQMVVNDVWMLCQKLNDEKFKVSLPDNPPDFVLPKKELGTSCSDAGGNTQLTWTKGISKWIFDGTDISDNSFILVNNDSGKNFSLIDGSKIQEIKFINPDGQTVGRYVICK